MLIAMYSICGLVMISCLIGIIVLLVFWRRHSDLRKKESAPISSDTMSADYEKLLSALMAHVKEKPAQNSSNTSTIDYDKILSVYMAYKSRSPEHYDTLIANLESSEKEALRQIYDLMVQNAAENNQKLQSERDKPLVTG